MKKLLNFLSNPERVLIIVVLLVLFSIFQRSCSAQTTVWLISECSVTNNISEQEVDLPIPIPYKLEIDLDKNKVFIHNKLYSTYRIDEFKNVFEVEGTSVSCYSATDEEFLECTVCISTWRELYTYHIMFVASYADITVYWSGKAFNKPARKYSQEKEL